MALDDIALCGGLRGQKGGAMAPMDRRSFLYRVYCSLVCLMKIHRNKRLALLFAADEFGWNSTKYAEHVYRRFIRPQLAAGKRIEELV